MCERAGRSDQIAGRVWRVTGPAETVAPAAEGEDDSEALIISWTAEKPLCERPASDALLYQHWSLTPRPSASYTHTHTLHFKHYSKHYAIHSHQRHTSAVIISNTSTSFMPWFHFQEHLEICISPQNKYMKYFTKTMKTSFNMFKINPPNSVDWN